MDLRCVPGVVFGFCYIPPADSAFYSPNSFSSIQEKLKTSENYDYILMGDMIARFGRMVWQLPAQTNPHTKDSYTYPVIPQQQHIYTSVKFFFVLIMTNMLLIIERHHHITSKIDSNRVPKIDTCAAAPGLLEYLATFMFIMNQYYHLIMTHYLLIYLFQFIHIRFARELHS